MSNEIAYFPDELAGGIGFWWYPSRLQAMNEPSLWQASSNKDLHTYRFLWLRTFDAPIAIRIETNSLGAGLLFAKATDGKAGYLPGKLVTDDVQRLTADHIDGFLAKLDHVQFWQLPATDYSRQGFDGADWVVEGVKDGRYHVVVRWSPGNAPFRELALHMVELSGLKVDKVY